MNSLHLIRRAGSNIANVVKRRPAILTTNILLTQKCVQNCLQCSIPANASENSVISFDDFKILVDRLARYGTQVLTLSGGDPMLHPHLAECIRYAVGKKFARVHLLTTLYGSERIVESGPDPDHRRFSEQQPAAQHIRQECRCQGEQQH